MGWDNDNWGRMHDFNANHGYYGVAMGVLFLIFLGPCHIGIKNNRIKMFF